MPVYKTVILTTSFFALALLKFTGSVSGQPRADYSATLGWDLSYKSVLERNRIENEDFLWDVEKYPSPILPILKAWRDPHILSSILIEFPAGHGDAHEVLWLIRTKDEAYYYSIVAATSLPIEKGKVEKSFYDNLLKTVGSWQQAGKPKHSPDTVMATDYVGFLSVYDGQCSKQIVLTPEDFLVENERNENQEDGRMMQILKQVPDMVSRNK